MWQPIETAPEAGFFLCWSGNWYVHGHIKTCTRDHGGKIVSVFDDGDAAGWLHEDYPTHWMPLPDPPKDPRTESKREGQEL